MIIPIRLVWYLTERCLEQCQGCPYSNNRDASSELTSLQAVNLLKDIIKLGVFSVSYTGGEPTLREDLFDLLKVGSEARIIQGLATNGRCIDKGYADRLKLYNVRGISLSISSSDKAKNDNIRGSGAYQSTLEAITNINRVNIPISISITIDDDGVKEIPELIKLCREFNLSDIRIQPKIDFIAGKANKLLSKQGMAELTEISHKYKEDISIIFGCSISYLHFVTNDKDISFTDYGLCDVGADTLAIKSDGTLTTCIQLLSHSENLGNLKQRTLKDILEKPLVDISRWQVKDMENRITGETCRNCMFIKKCKGGCKINKKDFLSSDIDCPKDLIYKQYL